MALWTLRLMPTKLYGTHKYCGRGVGQPVQTTVASSTSKPTNWIWLEAAANSVEWKVPFPLDLFSLHTLCCVYEKESIWKRAFTKTLRSVPAAPWKSRWAHLQFFFFRTWLGIYLCCHGNKFYSVIFTV